MSLYKFDSSSRNLPQPVGITEFEILKASHKFLREDDDNATTWDDQLAAKYYASLYREFAVCDLKHYKSGNFALRWRTEEEVLSGAGETTCGNTRCELHSLFQSEKDGMPGLTTLELPFAYVEHEESKSALVKVVLCGKCVKKLMWKRRKEKESAASPTPEEQVVKVEENDDAGVPSAIEENGRAVRKEKRAKEGTDGGSRRPRSSRSRSPRRLPEPKSTKRKRSPERRKS